MKKKVSILTGLFVIVLTRVIPLYVVKKEK
jgi:hypothetical protein